MRLRFSLLNALVLSVVFPTLALAQAGGSVVFLGTEALPLGGATLSVGPGLLSGAAPSANNRLYVGNLSFSGSDGFSMQIGGGSGGLVTFADEAASFPVGGEMAFVVSDGVGIEPCIRVMRNAGGVVVHPDFNPAGPSIYRAEVWNDGDPVVGFDGASGDITASGFPSQFLVDLEGVMAPLPDPFPLPATAPFALSNGFHLRWGMDVAFSIGSGGPMATGDELRLYPAGWAGLSSVVSIDVLVTVPVVSAPYTMSVDDLAQQQFWRLHRGTGGATILSHNDDAPTLATAYAPLANHREMTMMLDPDEVGGLRFDMHPSQSGECIIWDIKDGFVTGDLDEFSVTAELLAGGQGEVGKVSSAYNGTTWSVTPDFSGSGSPDAKVEVFDASGNLMGINPCVMGPFTVMSDYWPTETGVEDADDLTLVLGYATPVPVDLPGVGTVTGSTIKMHSNAPRRHKFFAIVDRSNLSGMGGTSIVGAEVNSFRLTEGSTQVDVVLRGGAYGKKSHDALVINDIDASGNDGVDIEPCILPAATPPGQFGVEWAPLGPPSANVGQTDWAFISKLATDPAPVQRMSIHMRSNGSVVSVMKDPGPGGSPEFRVVLKNGGRVVADFLHSSSSTPFAELPDWPIGVGYQVLHTPDQPWSMWIDLGYEMDVVTPGATTTYGSASLPLTKADLIEVIAQNTPNPGPPEKTVLSSRLAGIPFIVVLDRRPTPTPVDPTPPSVRTVLRPAYPNPFNPRTTLAFDLSRSGRVSLKIYAVDGRYVATVHEGALGAGPHTYEWVGVDHRGQPVASGVYLAELRAPDGILRTKVSLLK